MVDSFVKVAYIKDSGGAMTAEQFDYVVKVNGYKGVAIAAAKLVLINGMTFDGAGRQTGCTKSSAHAAVARVKKAYQRAFGDQ